MIRIVEQAARRELSVFGPSGWLEARELRARAVPEARAYGKAASSAYRSRSCGYRLRYSWKYRS
jgi:hypothetical protein